jgi:hypothetical protein
MDRWTTFAVLVGATAKVLRRHPALLLLPLTFLVGTAASVVFQIATDVALRPGLRESNWADFIKVLGSRYIGFLSFTVTGLALAHGSLQALREDRVSIGRAFAHACSRPWSVAGLALVAAIYSSALNVGWEEARGTQPVVVLLIVAWALVSTFAITTMAGERKGGIAAIRRSLALLQASWAEGRLAPIGFGLLWVPLIALEFVVLWWTVGGAKGLPMVLALLLNFTIGSATWLLGRIYAAAVYCYVVEGVVPAAFRDERLTDFWRVSALPASASLVVRAVAPKPRGAANLATFVVVSATCLVALALVVQQADRSGLRDRYLPRPGIAADGDHFGTGPRLLGSHAFEFTRERLSAVAAVEGEHGPVILAFGNDRVFRLRDDLALIDAVPLPPAGAGAIELEPLGLGGGRGVLVGVTGAGFHHSVVAFDWTGKFLFEHRADPGDTIVAVTPVRTRDGWGVAVGHRGSDGLCWLDSGGRERWCNKHEAGYVAAADCDGDGQDEILSVGPRGGDSVACYDLTGRQLKTISVPESPYNLRAVDLDGDGDRELVYSDRGSKTTRRFGAWRKTGARLVEVKIDSGPPEALSVLNPARPFAARRSATGPRDVAIIGPWGQLLGVSTGGDRWRAGRDYHDAAVIDFDGDGAEEIVALGEPGDDGYAIDVWSWTSSGTRPIIASATREDPPLRPLDSWQSTQFIAGCRFGVATAQRALANLSPDSRPRDDEASFCRTRRTQIDASELDEGSDVTRIGCRAGIYRVFKRQRRYEVAILETAHRMIDDCGNDAFGPHRRTTAAK